MPVAKNLGKSLLSHGLGLARDVTNDALAGKNIKSSLMDRGKAQAVNFGKMLRDKELMRYQIWLEEAVAECGI